MTTAAAIGHGSSFSIYNGSTYDAVAEVQDITPPNYSRDAVDATSMDSPNTFREYIAGLMDAGEASIELIFVPSATDALLTALMAGTGQFQVEFPNGVKVQFSAVVTAVSQAVPNEDKMTASASFKVTGKPTWVAAS